MVTTEIQVGDTVKIINADNQGKGQGFVGRIEKVQGIIPHHFGLRNRGFELAGEPKYFWREDQLSKVMESTTSLDKINKKPVQIISGVLKGLRGTSRQSLAIKVIVTLSDGTEVYVNRTDIEYSATNTVSRNMTYNINIDGEKVRIEMYNNKTIATLEDGGQGVSFCCPEDTFETETGTRVAYIRAKIASAEKGILKYKCELKEMAKF